jgi:hypothetical protein
MVSLLLLQFNPANSWVPSLGEFGNMIAFAFWWILAFVIAAIPIVIVGGMILMVLYSFLS